MKSEPKRMKAEASGSKRGAYVSQACSFCRRRKTRCDGKRPICTSCESSGHECTWGTGESAKRPSTKQYVESLRNRIKALESQVDQLQSRLAGCKCPSSNESISQASSSSHPVDYDTDDGYNSITGSEDEIEQLCAPTEHLVLEKDDLQLYGPTSIFRLAPKNLEATSPPRIPDTPGKSSHEIYILLLDGVDESRLDKSQRSLNWARHLPPEIPLSRRDHDKALDLLFKFFTSWNLRIVPHLFLRDMYYALSSPPAGGSFATAQPKTPHYSPMLHNSLLALALVFLDDPRLSDLTTSRMTFVRHAKTYLEDECARPGISACNALSMIASFHGSTGELTLGYMYFGMAGRMTQALGLNLDCSPWVRAGLISNEDKLDRDWAQWTAFGNDVCWSLYVGREPCVSPPDSLQVPVPYTSTGMDEVLWHYPPSGVPPQPGYLAKTFAVTCDLFKIARRIMDIVNGLAVTSHNTRREIDYALISQIDVDLNSWKENLPPEVDITVSSRATAMPHLIMLHLAYWWLFILLHRPFYRRVRASQRSEKEIDHVKLCNRAAENVMSLLQTWRQLYSLRFVSVTLTQVIFSAGTIFLLSAVHATAGARLAHASLAHALSQAELCIRFLRESGVSWPSSNIIAGILENLLHEQLKPRLQMRAVDTMYVPVISSAGSRQVSVEPTAWTGADMGRLQDNAFHGQSQTYRSSYTSPSPGVTDQQPHGHNNQLAQQGSSLAGSAGAELGLWSPPSFDPMTPGLFGGIDSSAVNFGFPAMGLTGMSNGEMLPPQSFIPLGGRPAYGGQGEDYQYHATTAVGDAQSLMSQEDLAALQQFFGAGGSEHGGV